MARAASLASRRSFSFRARWTSSSILGSEVKKLTPHVSNHREHISPSCAVSRGTRMSEIEKNTLLTDAHKSYSSENTPGSSSSNDDDSIFAAFHRPLSYLSGLVASEVLRAICACLWAWGRPDNALGTWADLTLRLPSVRYSPEVPISNPAEVRLIGGGGPRPMDE